MPAKKIKRKPSVLKRARQSEKRSERNKAVKSEVKTLAKRVLDAVGEGDKDKISAALKTAVKEISSAVSKGVLHRATASRKISRLAQKADAATRA